MITITQSGLMALAGLLFGGSMLVASENVNFSELSDRLAAWTVEPAAMPSPEGATEMQPVQLASYHSSCDCSDCCCTDTCDDYSNSCDCCKCRKHCKSGCCDDVNCSGEPQYLLDTSCACDSNECGDDCDCSCKVCGCETRCGHAYGEAQAMWLRAHINEDVVGKLSEFYELSPRFILGYEGASGGGARLRFWRFGEQYETIDTDERIDVNFGVFDAEGTKHLEFNHADVTFAGGVRFVDLKLGDDDNNKIDASLMGLTCAVDVRTSVCRTCHSDWAGVFGARWSILGGNWDGDNNDFTGGEVRDDNVVVNELYGGVEWRCCTRSCDFFSRLVWEMQNWHSDVLAQNSGTDSIGVVGPGVHLGVNY